MKVITHRPILVLTPDEKEILEEARTILDKFTDEDAEIVDEILDNAGYSYNNACDAYHTIGAILDEATTANSDEAKHLVVEYTTELVIG